MAGVRSLGRWGLVTAICATCFTLRAIIVALAAFDEVCHTITGLCACLWACTCFGYPKVLVTSCSAGIQILLLLLLLPAESNPERCWLLQRDAALDVLNHPLLNIIYYTACELVPSALVLYILRKLPPKRSTATYQQIPAQ